MQPQPICLGLTLFLSIGLAHNLYADSITFQFSGPVHQTSGNAPQAVGDFLTGSLTVDPNRLVTIEQGPFFRRFEGPVGLQLSFRRPSTGGAIEYNLPQERMNLVVNATPDAFRPLIWTRK